MTPSALSLIEQVRGLGGRLRPLPGDNLGVVLPPEAKPRLLPMLRERKPDLLMLLRYPATVCPACGGDRYRPDAVGQWHCERCEPEDPPDPFGPLPAGEAAAVAELELRAKLREPELARLAVSRPVVSGKVRTCQIVAASAIWASAGPEEAARRRAAAWDGVDPQLLAGHAISFRQAPGQFAIGEWVRTPAGNTAEVLALDAGTGEALVRTFTPVARWAWCPAAMLTSELDWEARH